MGRLKNIVAVVWLLLMTSFIIFKGIIPGIQDERSDFSNYYSSAKLIVAQEDLANFYNNDWFNKKSIEVGIKEGAKFAPFPPVTAFLFIPLSSFSELTAKRIWLVFNCVFLLLIVFQTKKLSSQNILPALLILSVFTIPIASNFRLGQTYLFFTLLILFALNSFNKKKYNLGASLIGFLAAIKYFPLLFIAALPSSQKKSILVFALSGAVVFFLPVVFFGLAPFQSFVNELFFHLNGNLSGQGQYSFNFQSIDALLANLFIYDKTINPNVLVDFPALKTGFKLGFVMVVCVFTFLRFRKLKTIAPNSSVGLVIIGGLLIIPASATYHLLFLLPAIVLIVKELKKGKEYYILLGLTFLTCSILPHHIPNFSNPTFNAIVHFPRLYGLMFLFIYTLFLQRRALREYG